ncbi:DUF397 domain-containing protein [Streptomyces sp. 11x1]|uniref:DUF397 domain-containing protein n=1 Tax=Streptomyces sp. 11x1 TaxID=3038642 RepID=UPI00292D3C09|nr:DUF397 domain-containing protein [Streptomyces sp. 11x1]WNZ10367.1 DUF397 domain-containing protein [Streptomyces sp. 11x1]
MSTDRTTPELAGGGAWFKSSYSDQTGASCLEVADLIPTRNLVALRDSKNPTGPTLTLSPDAFTTFVDSVKTQP